MCCWRGFESADDLPRAVARDLQALELALYDRMMAVDAIDEWCIDTVMEQCAEEDDSVLVAEPDGHSRWRLRNQSQSTPRRCGIALHLAIRLHSL